LKQLFCRITKSKNIKVTKEEFLMRLADKGVIARFKQGMIDAFSQSEEEIRKILPPDEAEEYISLRKSIIEDTQEIWLGYDENFSMPNAAEDAEVYE
jgi:hypothetical protein